jgi:anti-sigma factor RsiW
MIRKLEACEISDEDVELYVLGHLADPELRAHLDTCKDCRERVIECRDYIDVLRVALLEAER